MVGSAHRPPDERAASRLDILILIVARHASSQELCPASGAGDRDSGSASATVPSSTWTCCWRSHRCILSSTGCARPRSPWCREARRGDPGAVSEAIDREQRRLGQNKRREERLHALWVSAPGGGGALVGTLLSNDGGVPTGSV